MSECPFCERRDNGDFEQLYAGVAMRFEPLNPVTDGHMLFMPIEHMEHPHPDALATTMRHAGEYAAERSEDYNLITSSGAAATQTVPHMHIHYVPRRQGDGLPLPWTLAADETTWRAT